MKHLVRPALIAFLLAASVFSAPPSRPVLATSLPDYEPGQIVVRLVPQFGTDPLGINQTYGTTTLATLPDHPDTHLLQAPPGVDVELLVQAMAGDVRLAYAELNDLDESPEDGSTDRIYGWSGGDPAPMGSQDSAKAMRLEAAHDLSQGAGSLVALLDTGVQLAHPALADSLDPLGFDFVDDDATPADEANGLDDDGDGRVDEAYGHGTHVAGILHLVAPEARLLPLRVLDSDGRGNNFRTATAMVYAMQRGAVAINLSLGTPHASILLREMAAEAARQGIVVVAAAGNLNSDAAQYPAADACAIAVTSVNAKDKKSSFANFGEWIGVAAPGQGIYSTFPVDGYAWWSGTSMAVPFVAGQVALLRSAHPGLTLDEIGALIGGTAVSIDRINPQYRGLLGEGRIDLLASLKSAAEQTMPEQKHNLFAGCEA